MQESSDSLQKINMVLSGLQLTTDYTDMTDISLKDILQTRQTKCPCLTMMLVVYH